MLPALIGAAKTAGSVKSTTKLLPSRGERNQGGALVKQERPTMATFVGQVEAKKAAVSPSQGLILPPSTIGQPRKGSRKSEDIKIKITLLYKYFRERNKIDRAKRENQRKSKEGEKRKEKEETRENFAKGLVKGVTDKVLAPVKSIFDQILNAIGQIILAKIGMWAVDNPEIFANIINGISAAMDGITDIFIGVIDFTSSIINEAYKLVDGFGDWVDGSLGEDVSSMLNDLGPKVLDFLNASLIVGGLLIERALSDLKDQSGKPGATPGQAGTGTGTETKPGAKPTAAQKAENARVRSIQRNYGPGARTIYENALKNGKSPAQAQAAVDRAIKRGQIQVRPGADSLSGKGAAKGGVFRRGLGRSIVRMGIKMNPAMVQNMKAISKMAKGIRIPIIGPLIMGITEFLGSGNLGKAIFIGLGTALGELLGTAIPIPVVGTLLGGVIGAFVGDLLYDLIMKKDPKAALNKLKGAAKGIFTAGKAVFDWLRGGFDRFIKGIPQISFPDNFITKNFPLKFIRDLAGKKFPNPLWLINPFNMMDKLKLLKNSFFPANAKGKEADLSKYEEGASSGGGTRPGTSMPPGTASITKLGSGGGSLKSMTDQDWSDLAYIVSGEAARGTDDEYGVAAAVLNRVADPKWPNTIMGVGTQKGQFEAVYKGLARRDANLAKKLKANQGKIVEALKTLNGRTDFKGQSQLANKGIDDPMFHPRGNFYHYTSQARKSDPVPTNPPQHWRKLLGAGVGSFGDGSGGTTTSQQAIAQPPASPSPASFDYSTPSSPSASAVSSLGSSSGGSMRGSVPQVGSQGIVPIPVLGTQPMISNGASVISSPPDTLNSFYRAQLFGFLYKQG